MDTLWAACSINAVHCCELGCKNYYAETRAQCDTGDYCGWKLEEYCRYCDCCDGKTIIISTLTGDTCSNACYYNEGVAPCCSGCSCSLPACKDTTYPLDGCVGPGCSSTTFTCTEVDSCGKSCGGTKSKTCHKCVVPQKPSTPTSLTIKIGNEGHNITSTTASNPLITNYNMTSSRKVFSNAAPSGVNYSYEIYNAYTGGSKVSTYDNVAAAEQPASGSFSPAAGPARVEARFLKRKCPDDSKHYSGTKTGYFCLETNLTDVTQQAYKPSSIHISIKDKNIDIPPLSETENTIVPLVCPGEIPQMYIPNVDKSTLGAKEIIYLYSGSGGTHNSTTRVVNFTPASHLRTEGNTGSITGSFRAVNYCDSNYRESPSRTGKFKVEVNEPLSKPEYLELCVAGQCATKGSSSYGLSEDVNKPSLIRVSCLKNDTQMALPEIEGTAFNQNFYEFSLYPSESLLTTILESYRVQIYPDARDYLREGNTGYIVGRHLRRDRCNIRTEYSPTITGYYEVEKNEPLDKPEYISLDVDGLVTELSSNEGKPAKIKRPSTKENVQTVLAEVENWPQAANPSEHGSRVEVNNWGVNKEWIRWESCDSPYPEDYCKEEQTKTPKRFDLDFTPSNLSVLEVLKEGAQGEIRGSYYTCNLCGCFSTNPAYGSTVSSPMSDPFYYIVNRNPMVEGVKIERYEPDDNAITKNCVPEDNHTGKIQGKRVNVTVEGAKYDIVDGDDPEDKIRGMVLYFVKEDKLGSIEDIKEISDRDQDYGKGKYSDTDVVGIMIRRKGKNENQWDSDNLTFYATRQSDGMWVRRDHKSAGKVTLLSQGDSGTSAFISIPDLKNAFEVKREVEDSTERITFNFDVEFAFPDSGYLDGEYQVKAMVFDGYTLYQPSLGGNPVIDQTHGFEHEEVVWTFDFESPEIGGEDGKLALTTYPSSKVKLDLDPNTVDDIGTGVRNIVVDAYRDSPDKEDGLVLESPLDILEGEPGESIDMLPLGVRSDDKTFNELIGTFGAQNAWNFKTDKWPEEDVRVDIGDNEGGDIVFYATAFDHACNYSEKHPSARVDLRSWIATRGGIMYSVGNFGPVAKELGDTSVYRMSLGELSLRTLREDQILNEMTTGTRILMSRSSGLPKITHNSTVMAVRAEEVQDDNNLKRFWFNYFKLKLEKEIKKIGEDYEDIHGVDDDSGRNCRNWISWCECPEGFSGEHECTHEGKKCGSIMCSSGDDGGDGGGDDGGDDGGLITDCECCDGSRRVTFEGDCNKACGSFGGWCPVGSDDPEPRFKYVEYNSEEYIRNLGDEDICGNSDICAIYSKGPITLKNATQEGDEEELDTFVCDRKALIMSESDIHIEPDLINSDDPFVGCIIIANGNVTIGSGGYKSKEPDPGNYEDPGVVGYDYIEAFIMAERQIILNHADRGKLVRDGLEVRGSLISFGTGLDSLDKSILIERSLKLHNLTNPVLVMLWDVRYAKISEYFFGKDANLYKREVGFKVF